MSSPLKSTISSATVGFEGNRITQSVKTYSLKTSGDSTYVASSSVMCTDVTLKIYIMYVMYSVMSKQQANLRLLVLMVNDANEAMEKNNKLLEELNALYDKAYPETVKDSVVVSANPPRVLIEISDDLVENLSKSLPTSRLDITQLNLANAYTNPYANKGPGVDVSKLKSANNIIFFGDGVFRMPVAVWDNNGDAAASQYAEILAINYKVDPVVKQIENFCTWVNFDKGGTDEDPNSSSKLIRNIDSLRNYSANERSGALGVINNIQANNRATRREYYGNPPFSRLTAPVDSDLYGDDLTNYLEVYGKDEKGNTQGESKGLIEEKYDEIERSCLDEYDDAVKTYEKSKTTAKTTAKNNAEDAYNSAKEKAKTEAGESWDESAWVAGHPAPVESDYWDEAAWVAAHPAPKKTDYWNGVIEANSLKEAEDTYKEEYKEKIQNTFEVQSVEAALAAYYDVEMDMCKKYVETGKVPGIDEYVEMRLTKYYKGDSWKTREDDFVNAQKLMYRAQYNSDLNDSFGVKYYRTLNKINSVLRSLPEIKDVVSEKMEYVKDAVLASLQEPEEEVIDGETLYFSATDAVYDVLSALNNVRDAYLTARYHETYTVSNVSVVDEVEEHALTVIQNLQDSVRMYGDRVSTEAKSLSTKCNQYLQKSNSAVSLITNLVKKIGNYQEDVTRNIR